jgi:hypothetical protein
MAGLNEEATLLLEESMQRAAYAYTVSYFTLESPLKGRARTRARVTLHPC